MTTDQVLASVGKNVIEVFDDRVIEPAPYIFRRSFMAQEHNYLCAVCRLKSAVINCDSGVLNPCWECQGSFRMVKLNWFTKWFLSKELA